MRQQNKLICITMPTCFHLGNERREQMITAFAFLALGKYATKVRLGYNNVANGSAVESALLQAEALFSR